ncbi:MAG TPA: Ppx/GppA phosphatase family protein, partial [Actinomycetota bacterium]|nr:Ppx/GppA phosphatase family protein [Actinomycetota bacterium]
MADQPLAVIDVGSNSGRVVVLRLHGAHIEILADARAPLRLAAELKGGKLRSAAIERTVAAVRDFKAVADGAGAARVIAVATSAVRESSNADELVDAVARATGIDVEIIDGEEEARYSFLGAVHGLAIEHGTLVDIGGGSLEVTTFRNRSMRASYTLPLGALRLNERFFSDDPPSSGELRTLRAHIAETINEAGIKPLKSSEGLIGTGGTIRNLAKMDRRESNYPIPRVHGFVLHDMQVDVLTELVSSRPLQKRRRLRGLNADRADSIVAGALVLQTVMRELAAEEMTVSGQGLREGIAYDRLGIATAPAEDIRRGSVEALVARFTQWQPERAVRRAAIASAIVDGILPEADAELLEMLWHAAKILDVGLSVDYYNREVHAADVAIASDLTGFTHRQLAIVSALIRGTEQQMAWAKGVARLLDAEDADLVQRAAVALNLADEIERRRAPGLPGIVTCVVRAREIVV